VALLTQTGSHCTIQNNKPSKNKTKLTLVLWPISGQEIDKVCSNEITQLLQPTRKGLPSNLWLKPTNSHIYMDNVEVMLKRCWYHTATGSTKIGNLNRWMAQNIKYDLLKNNNHTINDIKQQKQ